MMVLARGSDTCLRTWRSVAAGRRGYRASAQIASWRQDPASITEHVAASIELTRQDTAIELPLSLSPSLPLSFPPVPLPFPFPPVATLSPHTAGADESAANNKLDHFLVDLASPQGKWHDTRSHPWKHAVEVCFLMSV